jgi:hypothetical protein
MFDRRRSGLGSQPDIVGASAMEAQHIVETARQLIHIYGMKRAPSIALERAQEQSSSAGVERWQRVHATICELRRSGQIPRRSGHARSLPHSPMAPEKAAP